MEVKLCKTVSRNQLNKSKQAGQDGGRSLQDRAGGGGRGSGRGQNRNPGWRAGAGEERGY